MKTKDYQYLYASARVRALENKLLSHDNIERMLESESIADILKLLSELGYPELDKNTSSIEVAISEERLRTFSLIRSISPIPEIPDIFAIKYDYHNLKTLIKTSANQSFNHLLINSGRIEVNTLINSVNENDLSRFTPTMRLAYENARDVFSRTSDAQASDIILDHAYFKELSDCAKRSQSSFLIGYVRLITDCTNLKIAVRALLQKKSIQYISRLFIDGGNISLHSLTKEISTDAPFDKIMTSSILEEAVRAASEVISSNGNLTFFERICDDTITCYLQSAKHTAFGAAPIIAYLAAKETELSNIRILLMAKLQNLPAEQIRERLRATYV